MVKRQVVNRVSETYALSFAAKSKKNARRREVRELDSASAPKMTAWELQDQKAAAWELQDQAQPVGAAVDRRRKGILAATNSRMRGMHHENVCAGWV